MPLISIITVVYNGSKTLEKSIKSVINQSFKDIDYVIIDGGSSDGTVEILKKYTDEISFWITEPDLGIYDAMNKGIKISRGQWIYFIGSDDYLHNQTVLEKIAGNLQSCECNFFYGNVIMHSQRKPYDGIFDLDKLLKRNISHQAIFYKKILFEKIGLFNIRYKICADWDFNIRCFQYSDINSIYRNMIIAYFAKGGASSRYDILFFRESIIPLRLKKLALAPKTLKNIEEYDEWWRLLRNAKIRSLDELFLFVNRKEIPLPIQDMVLWQKRIPSRVLKVGIISKLIMTLNYLSNLRRIKS